jgi:hypothetical protein
MIPVVDDFVKRFHLEDVVVVADSGLITKKNVQLLQTGKYKYILRARIRNEARKSGSGFCLRRRRRIHIRNMRRQLERIMKLIKFPMSIDKALSLPPSEAVVVSQI